MLKRGAAVEVREWVIGPTRKMACTSHSLSLSLSLYLSFTESMFKCDRKREKEGIQKLVNGALRYEETGATSRHTCQTSLDMTGQRVSTKIVSIT